MKPREKFTSLTLGIQKQAWEVLKRLNRVSKTELGIKDPYHFDFRTSALYNGREDGVVLEVWTWYKGFDTRERLYIYWSECRSSDGIFVSTWMDEKRCCLNPPVIMDRPDYAYRTQSYFEYQQYDKAVEKICEHIREFVVLAYQRQLNKELDKVSDDSSNVQ